MAPPFVRPRVTDLVFHLYGRPLHPELFDTLAVRTVSRDDYRLTTRITRTGHVISFDGPHGHLTEVTATTDQELPERHRLMRHRLHGEHTDRLERGPALSYHVSSQVESLPPEVFRHVHDELALDGLKRGFFHNFRTSNRLALAPLGLVTSDAWEGTLVLATFHTFPEECAVVKTQSLIERRG